METLLAYAMAKVNDGAPGIDGVTFEDIEAQGAAIFLRQIQDELIGGSYVPLPARKQEIPKDGGKVRTLSIPAIRDRGTGALKRYWSRFLRQTSRMGRLVIVQSVRRVKPWIERQRQSHNARPA